MKFERLFLLTCLLSLAYTAETSPSLEELGANSYSQNEEHAFSAGQAANSLKDSSQISQEPNSFKISSKLDKDESSSLMGSFGEAPMPLGEITDQETGGVSQESRMSNMDASGIPAEYFNDEEDRK